MVKSTPIKCTKVNNKLTKDVIQTSQMDESPIIKKRLPGIYY